MFSADRGYAALLGYDYEDSMSEKTALITGVTGEDGAYLSRLLLEKGYIVHGVKRRSSSFNTGRIDDLYMDPHADDVRFFCITAI